MVAKGEIAAKAVAGCRLDFGYHSGVADDYPAAEGDPTNAATAKDGVAELTQIGDAVRPVRIGEALLGWGGYHGADRAP